MSKQRIKKNITLDGLALMVTKGFENSSEEIKSVKQEMQTLKTELKTEIQGLRNSVNNYLKLTDKRYIELKNNQKILAKYIKLVLQKSQITVDTKDLESILK